MTFCTWDLVEIGRVTWGVMPVTRSKLVVWAIWHVNLKEMFEMVLVLCPAAEGSSNRVRKTTVCDNNEILDLTADVFFVSYNSMILVPGIPM